MGPASPSLTCARVGGRFVEKLLPFYAATFEEEMWPIVREAEVRASMAPGSLLPALAFQAGGGARPTGWTMPKVDEAEMRKVRERIAERLEAEYGVSHKELNAALEQFGIAADPACEQIMMRISVATGTWNQLAGNRLV